MPFKHDDGTARRGGLHPRARPRRRPCTRENGQQADTILLARV